MASILINFVATLFSPPNCSFDLSVTCSVTNVARQGALSFSPSLIQIKLCIFNEFLNISGIISAHPLFSELTMILFSFFSWMCRLSKWVLRPRRKLRFLPSGATVVAGPNPGRSPLCTLLGPHRDTPWRYGPPPTGPPPFQRGAALLWYHVPPPRGLSQPRTRNPRAAAQHLIWGVRPQSSLYLTVTEWQRI